MVSVSSLHERSYFHFLLLCVDIVDNLSLPRLVHKGDGLGRRYSGVTLPGDEQSPCHICPTNPDSLPVVLQVLEFETEMSMPRDCFNRRIVLIRK